MANTLTAIQRTILARGLDVLRQRAVMPRNVHIDRSIGGASAQRGDVINVAIPPTLTVSDVTPAVSSPAPTDQTPTTVQIPVNKWKKAGGFALTDKEMNQLINPNEHFIPQNVDAAVTALAEYINNSILEDSYKEFYGYVGTAGTTPFAGTTATDAAAARRELNKQKAPMGNRALVMDPDAGANAVINPQLSDMDKVGTAETRMTGELGQRLGFDWFEDQQVGTHTRGTLTGSPLVNDAAVAIGDTTLDIDATSLTGTVVAGDVFTVAGDTQTYVVTTGGTAAANALAGIVFDPPAKVAWADNAAVTFKASHVYNLAFHRDGIAFVSVPLQKDPLSNRATQFITDPVTGITLRLEFIDQYKRSYWEFDVLFGHKVLRSALGCRIAG